MPQISRFFGIIIMMYADDHNPPHFHARYGEYEAEILLSNFSVKNGWLPPRVLGMVMEWATEHKDELMNDWERAKRFEPLLAIAPLD